MIGKPENIDEVLLRLEEIESLAPQKLLKDGVALAKEQLGLGELILRTWVMAHDQAPTDQQKEGFVLLALHHQGSKGIPSFNACRETCREIVFHHNVIVAGLERFQDKWTRLSDSKTRPNKDLEPGFETTKTEMALDDEASLIKALRLMVMVVRHLALFVSGKLEVAGLGEFCCASKPLRQGDSLLTSSSS